MADGYMIKEGGPADSAMRESIGVHIETNTRNGTLHDPFREKREPALGQKEIVRSKGKTGKQAIKTGIQRNRPIKIMEFHSALVESLRIGRQHFPTAVFGCEAEDLHGVIVGVFRAVELKSAPVPGRVREAEAE